MTTALALADGVYVGTYQGGLPSFRTPGEGCVEGCQLRAHNIQQLGRYTHTVITMATWRLLERYRKEVS